MGVVVTKKQLVLPGELLAENNLTLGGNVYKENNKIFASRIGLADFNDVRINVVPLKGSYIPSVDDQIIGCVTDIGMSGWTVDISSPYPAMLPASEAVDRRQSHGKTDLTKILKVNDLIIAKIIAFDRTRDPLLTIKGPGLGRITSGRVITISATKVPRLIGRKGSMVSMLKKEIGCEIMIGQNGFILVSSNVPSRARVALEAIRKIEIFPFV